MLPALLLRRGPRVSDRRPPFDRLPDAPSMKRLSQKDLDEYAVRLRGMLAH